jgi:hypothetical protein
VRTEPAPAAAPSREELTVAWGDRILPSLRPAVKVYVANGRFLPSDGDQAIYAVPDRGLLTRAEANRVEVEGAIGQHFGRPVRMRLVLDPDGSGSGSGADAGGSGAGAGGRPGGGPAVRGGGPAVPAAGGRMESAVAGGPAPDDHDQHDVHDWADLEEAPAAVSSPEQRLLDAFPGAEEVPP